VNSGMAGWGQGHAAVEARGQLEKLGNNCLTSPRLVHLFLPCHGVLSSRVVYLNPT